MCDLAELKDVPSLHFLCSLFVASSILLFFFFPRFHLCLRGCCPIILLKNHIDPTYVSSSRFLFFTEGRQRARKTLAVSVVIVIFVVFLFLFFRSTIRHVFFFFSVASTSSCKRESDVAFSCYWNYGWCFRWRFAVCVCVCWFFFFLAVAVPFLLRSCSRAGLLTLRHMLFCFLSSFHYS